MCDLPAFRIAGLVALRHDDNAPAPEPLVTLEDGTAVLYRECRHLLSGDPGGGKTLRTSVARSMSILQGDGST